MLNKRALRLITLFIVLLLPGIFFGNLVLVGMSLVPLSLLVVGLALSPPRPVSAETVMASAPRWAGDTEAIVRRVRISGGIGMVRLYQPLPTEFALVEGNNMVMQWQWSKPAVVEISFAVELARRGRYSLPPVQWVSRHPLGLTREEGTVGRFIDIEVWPRFYRPRSVKSLPGLSVTPFPSSDIAKIGIPGQDFREIRKYVTGDPIKNINWRATARRAEQSIWPLVNEFEREGRKSVLIYLHASHATEVGSTIENGLECGLEASANLLFYYLEKGYRTGICICGQPTRYFYPEAGRVQFRKALRALVELRPGYQASELLTAVETTKDYVLGYNPLTVLVTTLDVRSARVVENAVHRIRQMYSRRRRPSIMVVGVDAYGLIPQDADLGGNTAALMRLQTRPLVRRLRSYGANIVEWHPAQETFSSVFSKQAWAK